MLSRRPRRGEIWFVFTPGQPNDPHQPRPALILSADVRNRVSDDSIIVPAFSGQRPGPTRVAIRAGMGGIPRDSTFFCTEVTTLHDDFLADGPLGDLVSNDVLEQVVRAVRRAIGDTLAEP